MSNNILIADAQQASLGVIHATSGHTQHSHPFRETDTSGSSMFHENITHQAVSIYMTTNGKEEYKNDIILVFDSGRKDITNFGQKLLTVIINVCHKNYTTIRSVNKSNCIVS